MLNSTFNYHSDNDLRLFLLYVNDVCQFYKISEYRFLKTVNLRKNFLADIRRQLKGGTDRRTKFSLWLLIHINKYYPLNIDMPKYLGLLGVSPNSIELKSIDSILTTYKTKKAPCKLIQEA